jgi:iron complex outermembrane receptor protein
MGARGIALLATMAMAMAPDALAQPRPAPPAAAAYAFAIPPGPLAAALNGFGRATGLTVLFTQADAAAARSPGVAGSMGAEAALTRLLAGTGWTHRFADERTVTLAPTPVRLDAGAAEVPQIDVTAAPATALIGPPPPAYAGGQVATGGRVGLLGNRGFMETPFSSSSYTEQLIRDQQARIVGDVLQNDPSVRVTSSRGNYFDQFFVRGFQILVSEVALDGLFSILPNRRPTLEAIDRVELLRGPNALLSGISPFGSIAGTINLVPKFATDAPITRVTTGFVSRSNLGTTIDVGRRYGEAGEFGIRGNFALRGGNNATDGQTERYLSGDLAFDYRGERLRLTALLGANDERLDRGLQVITLAPGLAVPRPPRNGTNLQQPWETQEFDAQHAAFRVEYDLLPGTTIGAAYGAGRSYERWYSTGIRITGAGGAVTATPSYYNAAYVNQTAEATIRSRFTTGPVAHTAIIAANALWRDIESRTATVRGGSIRTNLFDPVYVADPGRGGLDIALRPASDAQLTSLALTDVMSLLDERIELLAGIRAQRIAARSYDANTGARTSRYAATALTPAFGLTLRPIPELSFYANYIEGLTQGPTAPATARNANQVFAPALSRQYEAGAKLDLGRFGAQLAWFRISQQSGATDPATNLFGVIGQQRNEGLELLTFGEPVRGLRLLGGVTYTEGLLTRTAGGTNNGRTAPGVPRWSLSMGAELDVPGVEGLTATGRVIATSSQFYDAANTQRIPGWARLDIGARYGMTVRGQPVVIRAAIENVTGATYWQSAARGFLAPSAPRTYLLSTGFEF